MGLVLLDGFAFRNVSSDGYFYDAGFTSIGLVTPPFPASSAVQGIIQYTPGAPEEFEDICCGLRWKNILNGQPPIMFSNALSGFFCFVSVDGAGRFTLTVELSGSPFSTDASTLNISSNEWNYLELAIQTSKIHIPYQPPTMSTPEIPEAYKMLVLYNFRVNDEVFLAGGIQTPERLLSGSGIDSNPWIAHLNVGAITVNALGNAAMTDWYVTASPGNIKGDSSIRTLYPAGDVGQDFTPSVGTLHYPLVNDHPDVVSTYNSATAVSQIDSYSFDQLAAWAGGTQTINGVMALWHLSNSDPNSGGVFGFYNTPSHFTGVFYPPPAGVQYFVDCQEFVWGSTSAKWTEGAINSITIGTERLV